jgi:hypothetical protein
MRGLFRTSRWMVLVAAFFAVASAAQATGPVFPLKASANSRYLVDQRNRPVFINGDTPWSLASQVSREDVELYLKQRAGLGVNSLIITIPEGFYCDGCQDAEGPRDRYGHKPFLVRNKFTAPNPKYFEHADWVIRRAGDFGMQVLMSPLYTGYDSGKETSDGWYAAVMRDNSVADCRCYGEWIGKRYRAVPNLIYVIGNDRDPGGLRDKLNAFAEGIRSQDATHLVTYHARPGRSSAEVWPPAQYLWLTLNSTYLYGDVWLKSVEDYFRVPRMPFVLFESRYENEGTGKNEIRGTPQQVRLQAYASVLGGSCGHHYGNSPVWHMNAAPGYPNGKSPWKLALNDPGALTLLPHIKALFESRAWHTLTPDRDRKLVIRTDEPIPAAVTEDRSTAIIYVPPRRTVTVDTSRLSGLSARAWWFNPRDGRHIEIGIVQSTPYHKFTGTSPEDWVLVLDDELKKRQPPGTR